MLKSQTGILLSGIKVTAYSAIASIAVLIGLSGVISAAPVFTPLVQLPDTGHVDPTVLDFANSTITLDNGDIWFHYSRYNTNEVAWLGKIAYGSGQYTLYSIPYTTNSNSRDIFFLDDERQLWFTGYKEKLTLIDTTTPTPTLTYFNLPITGQFGYIDFRKGPNGNYWYFADSKLIEVSESFDLIRSIPFTGFSNSSRFVLDNQNNAWVANYNGTGVLRKVNLLDTNQFQDFIVTTNIGSPWFMRFVSMSVDKEDTIWLAQNSFSGPPGSDLLTRITQNGTITTWAVDDVANLFVGADDNIYYSQSATMIGSIDIESETLYSYDFDNFKNPLGVYMAPDNSISFGYRWETKDPTYVSNGTAGIGTIDFGFYSPPTTQIVSPVSNSLTKESIIDINVNSSDEDKVTKLELYVNNVLADTVADPTPTQAFEWDTSGIADGTYSIMTRAYDKAFYKYTATSTPITITLDKTKPTIALSTPTSGTTLTGSTTVSATASDTNGVAGVQFKLNGSLYGTEDTVAPYSFSWDTASFVDGTYSVSAVARDMAGNTAESSSITVTVANTVVLADVTVCHFPGTQEERTLTVSATAVNGHLGHGDYRGRCIPVATANTFVVLDAIEELEEVSVVRQADNTILATIDEGSDLSSVNLDLRDEETLLVDGLLGSVNVKQGATIKGNGKVKSLVVDEGAYLAPGSSPGCLTTEGLLLEGTYTFELGGSAACIEHDQVIVNGGVTLSGLLEIELENNYRPEIGQSFIIISNDGAEAVTTTFTNTPEGGLTEAAGVSYRVSYVGGDGNDVELTVTAVDENIADAETEATAAAEGSEKEEDGNGGMYVVAGVIIAIVVVVVIMQVVRPGKK